MPDKARVVILGAGMSGFGAAHKLHSAGITPCMYESKPYHGGNTASFTHASGFVFDQGPHISFTEDERIQQLFLESVGHVYEQGRVRVQNYWRGHWFKHPAQCNLYGLPEDLVCEIIQDFTDVQGSDLQEAKNYADWLQLSFGRTFAQTFPSEYCKKYHTTAAENLTTDWLGPRLYRPQLEELVRGAKQANSTDVHYVTEFRYPSNNGFVSFLNTFLDKAEMHLNYELLKFDPKTRKAVFANGESIVCEHLISSIPLPELVSRIAGVPADVAAAAKQLACTSCVLVNVGIDRSDLSNCHWTYFYDQDIVFTRLSFPHMMSPQMTPSGAGSIQAELYYSDKYRPLDCNPEQLIEPVLRDLKQCGVLRGEDCILFTEAKCIPYANIIFDHQRSEALARVHGYLEDICVECCGRYGEWGYHWTDQAFLSGEAAAERVLDAMK